MNTFDMLVVFILMAIGIYLVIGARSSGSLIHTVGGVLCVLAAIIHFNKASQLTDEERLINDMKSQTELEIKNSQKLEEYQQKQIEIDEAYDRISKERYNTLQPVATTVNTDSQKTKTIEEIWNLNENEDY